METTKPLIEQSRLQHLSYTELSRATRATRKLLEEEGKEESEIVAVLKEAGHSEETADALLKRARLEIVNEKIKKSFTAIIVLAVLSAGAVLLLPLFAADTVSGGGMARRVYFWIAAIPVVTVIWTIRHLVLMNERKYLK